jgi:hypothetical protein
MKNFDPVKSISFLLIFLFFQAFIQAQLPSDFPGLSVNNYGETDSGYIFITVSADVEGIGYYIMMLDDTGNPINYKKLDKDYSYDFKVQPNGLLSYAQFLSHHSYTGGGNCIHMVMDEDMNVVDSFQLKNGYIAEAHDFQILPNGHVLAFGYYLTPMDLSDLVDGGYPNALVSGGIVQEFDQDKNVVWQWRSWDHYNYKDFTFTRASNQIVSAFHLNTVNLDTDGNLFLATPSWTKKINRQTGEIMWHLGGDENEFSFVGVDSLEGVDDLTGHAFHRLENGNVLIYDNGPRKGAGTSEAHEYKLDEVNKIAEKVKTFTPTSDIPGWHRGNAQRLPNGNTIVGWGGATGKVIPACTEFDSLGNTVFELFYDNPAVESYRAFRFPFPSEKKYEGTIEEAAQTNTYDVLQGDTLDIGVEVYFSELISIGYNEFQVDVYNYAPQFPEFESRAPAVLPQRIVTDKYAINFVGGKISFDIEKYNLTKPDEITIYFRPNQGEGFFKPLNTSFNSVTKKLSADFDDFGEFIFTYPDIEHKVFAPKPVTPVDNELVNFELPIHLEWSQDGFFNSFKLQVARDESFNDLLMNPLVTRSTVYELEGLPVGKEYFWRVKTTNDAGESEWSETAKFQTVSPFVKLNSPNGNEVWNRGLKYFVEWESNFDDDVILELFNGSDKIMVIDTVENTQAYYWDIPVNTDSTCNYHIEIRSLTDSAIHDLSDFSFSINENGCLAEVVPYVELIFPNGGERLEKGSAIEISWFNNTGENVDIELYKGNDYLKTLFSELNSNTASWLVDNELENGEDYRIVVKGTGVLQQSDASNADVKVTGNQNNISMSDNHESDFTIYPNPVKDKLFIQYHIENTSPALINLYDIHGIKLETVMDKKYQNGKQLVSFDMSDYPAGIYIIRFISGEKSESKTFYFEK